MRIVVMSCVVFLSYLLQSTFFEYIKIYGIKPNLIVVTIISYALIRGKEEGAIYGLFSGLLLDIMAGKIVGIYALLGMYLGLFIGRLNKNVYNENYLNVIMLTAGGTFLYNAFYFIFTMSDGMYNSFKLYLITIFLPEILYNSVISIFVFFIILYINKKLDYYNRRLNSFKL